VEFLRTGPDFSDSPFSTAAHFSERVIANALTEILRKSAFRACYWPYGSFEGRSLVKKELLSNDLNLDDEESIDFLAKRFQVSTAAMSHKLLNLNVLP
jgi:hypothetical protein